MKVSYVEGLASHNGPESCGAAREGGVEALTGERIGRVWSREIYALLRKQQVLRGADAVEMCGRQHRVHRHRKVCSDPGGQGPRACTQAPCAGTGRSHVCLWPRELQAASGSRRTYVDDERTWEVGQLYSTWEVAEPSRGTGSGGDGGKGAGQGKLARA